MFIMRQITPYQLTRDQLLADLYTAYFDARRHKRNKPYQLRYEARLEANIEELCEELWTRTYKPRPSTCFIISDPKPREVFAADFRDRIVHHLYFNYTHEMYERTFIADSYSCIKKRGTHYGIHRLDSHIRKESQNYTEPCYAMKMDIRGYFMHINRQKLLSICNATLSKMSTHRITKKSVTTWQETVDMDFIFYLTREIVLLNPTVGCRIKGSKDDWKRLPHDKSLFNSPEGCGLPIGNLTSQLFCNVYMNELDQFMKRRLRCRHYGRYVDDFYVVSADKEWLHSLLPAIRAFLRDTLGLFFHDGKLIITDIRRGVEYLGAYIKPWRMYVSNVTLRRMKRKIPKLMTVTDAESIRASVNSFLGVLSHYCTYRIIMQLFVMNPIFYRYGSLV